MRAASDLHSDPTWTPDDPILGHPATEPAGLAELLEHLLGGGSRIMADAALSRFCTKRLAAIQRGAEAQASNCMLGLQALSHVLGVALEHPRAELPASVLAGVVWHIHGQLHAMDRWQDLAANARHLRDNPAMAKDIACSYAIWSRSMGEWPEVDG